ncbi:MAG TPA: hypothetical protein VL175_21230 [Pirellulales bacterium]|nr:hypothetical protein [Pirellulales bacterium]
MPFDWRQTLRMLLTQFESSAARSPGLHHLFLEVADHERHKMQGPSWFRPFSSKVRIVDGLPIYSKWDCSAFAGLPGISPGFREAKSTEIFNDNELAGVIRDRSGVARAVATPMKLCQGYFCGQPSEQVDAFKALADAAAAALAGATDLDEHVFASDLTDIFRKPRGGVRYIFGDIPNAPKQFIARGWSAGVLQFDNGVLIDLPIAESPPDSGHWVLLLHRLGWHNVAGSALRARRMAWDENVEVAVEMLSDDLSQYPAEFSAQFSKVSRESFYSVLGTKDAPLDINFASALAIQLLLDKLELHTSVTQEVEPVPDYSREPWKPLVLPSLRTVTYVESRKSSQPRVGILVATEVERQAVLKKMRPPRGRRRVLQVYSGSNTCFVGRLGVTDVVLCMTAVGSIGRDSSTIVTTELIASWNLSAVIMAGIAFGKDASKQEIGSVIVSDRVISYEPERLGTSGNQDRGSAHMAGALLLNRFRNIIGWDFRAPNGTQCGFQIGPILSGEKLVDDPKFKDSLFERFPTALGGEMEGAGVAAAAERRSCDWIVVKAICDWGDGKKTKIHQEFAAASSVALIEHVLNQAGSLDST